MTARDDPFISLLKLLILGSVCMAVLQLASGVKQNSPQETKNEGLNPSAPGVHWELRTPSYLQRLSWWMTASSISSHRAYSHCSLHMSSLPSVQQEMYHHIPFLTRSSSRLPGACMLPAFLFHNWIGLSCCVQLAAVTKLLQNPWEDHCFHWAEGTRASMDHTGRWEEEVCFYSNPGKLSLPGGQLQKLEGHWENYESH